MADTAPQALVIESYVSGASAAEVERAVPVQVSKSGAGAAMGAIAGGAIGNTVSRGAANAAPTMLGIMGGAILGERIEGTPETRLQNVQHCAIETLYENRTVGYNVQYEFGGKQYAVQLPQDPGPTIRLQVAPVGVSTASPIVTAPASAEYVQMPTYVLVSPNPPVYYPPIRIGLGFGYWDHRRWH